MEVTFSDGRDSGRAAGQGQGQGQAPAAAAPGSSSPGPASPSSMLPPTPPATTVPLQPQSAMQVPSAGGSPQVEAAHTPQPLPVQLFAPPEQQPQQPPQAPPQGIQPPTTPAATTSPFAFPYPQQMMGGGGQGTMFAPAAPAFSPAFLSQVQQLQMQRMQQHQQHMQQQQQHHMHLQQQQQQQHQQQVMQGQQRMPFQMAHLGFVAQAQQQQQQQQQGHPFQFGGGAPSVGMPAFPHATLPLPRMPLPTLPPQLLQASRSANGSPSVASMMQMVQVQQRLLQQGQQHMAQHVASMAGAVPQPSPQERMTAATPVIVAHSLAATGAAAQSGSRSPLHTSVSTTRYASVLSAPSIKAETQEELKQPEPPPQHQQPQVGLRLQEGKEPAVEPGLPQQARITEMKSTEDVGMRPPLINVVAPPMRASSTSAVMAAAAAASAASEMQVEPPPPLRLPADVEMEHASPAELHAVLQRMRSQNVQLQRCYSQVKQRFHDVSELVEKSTAAADTEPPEVLMQIQTILHEAAARDAQLQHEGVEEDHDPGTSVPSTPAPASMMQPVLIAGRSDPRGKDRSKLSVDASELGLPSTKRRRQPSTGAEGATPGGSAEVESAAQFLSNLAGIAGMPDILTPRPTGGAVGADGSVVGAPDRKVLIHTSSRVRRDAVAHSYGTRPRNRSAKFVLEASPSPSDTEDDELKGEESGGAPRSVKKEPMAGEEEDEYATSDDYEAGAVDEDEFEDDELIDDMDEEFTTHARAPRVRIRNRSKAARAAAVAAAAAAAGMPTPTSPAQSVGSAASKAAFKKSLAMEGRHAMTSISQNVSRYPLQTVFVKVANMWTVQGKTEAKQLGREEQLMQVLVPVRFMVLNPAARADPHKLSREDVMIVAKDISVLIHKRKGSVAKSIYNFTTDEKVRIHVCSRPREAGRGSGVVGGGASISGGGASTTGLSTQVLTVLSWQGVQRLLKHSRSSLAPHVRRWVEQQYDAIISNAQLLKDHFARAARMDRLKTLPVAQARAEETKLLRMEEEEEMDVYEGFEHLARSNGGGGAVSEDMSSEGEDSSVVKEEPSSTEPAEGAAAAVPVGSVEASASSADAAAAASTPAGELVSENAGARSESAPAPPPVPAKKSHKKKGGGGAAPRRSHHKAKSAQPAAKRAKVEKKTAAPTTTPSAPDEAAAMVSAGEEAAPSVEGERVFPDAAGAREEGEVMGAALSSELPPLPPSATGGVRVSHRKTKGIHPTRAALEAAEAEEAEREQARQTAAEEARAAAMAQADTPSESPQVYQAELVQSPGVSSYPSAPYPATMVNTSIIDPRLLAAAQTDMAMSTLSLPVQASQHMSSMPFPLTAFAQSSILASGTPLSQLYSSHAGTSPLHFLASASSSAQAEAPRQMEAGSQQVSIHVEPTATGTSAQVGTPPQRHASIGMDKPLSKGDLGGEMIPSSMQSPLQPPSAHTSPMFESECMRRHSIDSCAITQPPSPHQTHVFPSHMQLQAAEGTAQSRSILHVTHTNA